MNTPELRRAVHTTSREMDFFTEKGTAMEIGHAKPAWPVALLLELIANSLDASESADTPPEIEVGIEPDAFWVRDYGPGLPFEIIERSLDYRVRVSDKAHYVSPTRGQLGNALKCLWAAPFVADGERGRVVVETGGVRHEIEVTLDRIAGAPKIERRETPDAPVKIGTLIRIEWPGVASYLEEGGADFYSARDLLRAYALFNPHLKLRLFAADGSETEIAEGATC